MSRDQIYRGNYETRAPERCDPVAHAVYSAHRSDERLQLQMQILSAQSAGFCRVRRQVPTHVVRSLQQNSHGGGGFPDKFKVIRLFYIGEPLLCPDFLKMLELTMRLEVTERIELTTNASMLTPKMSEGILQICREYPSTALFTRYSIYSPRQDKNELITSSKIPVERIRDNIAEFQRIRDELKLKNVSTYAKMLSSFDEREDNEFLDAYRDVVDDVAIELPHNWSSVDDDRLLSSLYSTEKLKRLVEQTAPMPKVCGYPFTTMAVQSDGQVVICCVDWSRGTYIGDASKESLVEIWNGERLKNIRRLHLTGRRGEISSCRNCQVLQGSRNQSVDSLDDVSPSILD